MSPSQEVSTGWNRDGESLIEHKQAVSTVLLESRKVAVRNLMLSPSEVTQVESIYNICAGATYNCNNNNV